MYNKTATYNVVGLLLSESMDSRLEMTEAEQAQLGLSALRPHPGKIRQNPLFFPNG